MYNATDKRTYVDAAKIVGVHNCPLIELDLCEMSLEQTFQLQSWLFSATTHTDNQPTTTSIWLLIRNEAEKLSSQQFVSTVCCMPAEIQRIFTAKEKLETIR